ncbi:MAG TPA: YciI family protein [Acidobacteriota bacterium]|nr:YciI family protein [Acidobacteriota bacterium]
MKIFLSISVAALVVLAGSLPCASADKSDPLWFVFLTKGSVPRPENQDELMKMQEAHLKNFERRFAEGKLLSAGPLNDPTRFLRGIVVLQVPDRTEVRRCFDGDPYVENGIMDLDAFIWGADPAMINTHLPDPKSIEENRLLMINQVDSSELDSAKLAAHREYALKSYPSRLQGEAKEGPFRRIILFQGTDETSIRAAMANDPLSQAKGVEFKLIPLWLAKGVLEKR